MKLHVSPSDSAATLSFAEELSLAQLLPGDQPESFQEGCAKPGWQNSQNLSLRCTAQWGEPFSPNQAAGLRCTTRQCLASRCALSTSTLEAQQAQQYVPRHHCCKNCSRSMGSLHTRLYPPHKPGPANQAHRWHANIPANRDSKGNEAKPTQAVLGACQVCPESQEDGRLYPVHNTCWPRTSRWHTHQVRRRWNLEGLNDETSGAFCALTSHRNLQNVNLQDIELTRMQAPYFPAAFS